MDVAYRRKSALALCLLAGFVCWRPGMAAAQPMPAEAVPECNREHVYVYMVNGLTVLPHIYGSMNQAGPTLTQHGYCHNQTATHYYRWSFQDNIRCVHRCDPQARIVLIGYSIGAGVVHSIAHTLDKEGIPVALMVYLDGHTFVNNFHQRPCNVERIVCITSSAHFLRGCAVPEADCLEEIADSRHLSVPKKDATLQILLRELDAVAATVAPVAPPEQGATPAPVVTQALYEFGAPRCSQSHARDPIAENRPVPTPTPLSGFFRAAN